MKEAISKALIGSIFPIIVMSMVSALSTIATNPNGHIVVCSPNTLQNGNSIQTIYYET